MKKISKRFIISVLTLVLTIVALGTNTFAWFSLSTTSKVSNIGGQVTAGDGLQIQFVGQYWGRKDGETEDKMQDFQTGWMSNINLYDFSTSTNSNFKFDAVTTPNGYGDFTKMGQTNNGNLHLNAPAVANRDYLEFTINFRSQVAGTVNLTDLSFGGGTGEEVFKPDSSPYLQADGSTGTLNVLTRAAYGARVSFVVGNPATAENTTVYQMDNESNGLHLDIDNGVVKGNHVTENKGVKVGQYSYLTDGLGLKIYDNAVENAQILDPTTVTIASAKTAVSTESGGTTTYHTSIELTKNSEADDYLGSTTVRIWIEGWDADSYDSIYKLLLLIDMTFKKVS